MPDPTLQQIADRAGCSKATVSLALRNDPRIKEATRNRVTSLAKAMGYHPNPALSGIASQRWRRDDQPRETIAYINFRKYAEPDPASSPLSQAMEVQAIQLGYRLEIFPWHHYGSLEKITAILRNRGIRGVLLGATTLEEHSSELARFPWNRFCLVGCELGFHRLPIPTLIADHFSAARQLYRTAAKTIAGPIAIVMQTKGFSINDEQTEAGFLYEHWLHHPLDQPKRLRISLGSNDRATLMGWFESERPAGLVTNVAASLSEQLNLKAENVFALSAGWSAATGLVKQPLKQIGALASAMLAGRLNRNEYGKNEQAESILVPYETMAT